MTLPLLFLSSQLLPLLFLSPQLLPHLLTIPKTKSSSLIPRPSSLPPGIQSKHNIPISERPTLPHITHIRQCESQNRAPILPLFESSAAMFREKGVVDGATGGD